MLIVYVFMHVLDKVKELLIIRSFIIFLVSIIMIIFSQNALQL